MSACYRFGCYRPYPHLGEHWVTADQPTALLRDTPEDRERLAEVLKEYDAGRVKVKYLPGVAVGPGGNPTRFHRAWADALLAALRDQR